MKFSVNSCLNITKFRRLIKRKLIIKIRISTNEFVHGGYSRFRAALMGCKQIIDLLGYTLTLFYNGLEI